MEKRRSHDPAVRVSWRRLRGALLRVAFNRRAAIAAGATMLGLAAVLLAGDFAWESWVTDGAGLVLAATGAALVAIGLSGRRPDWVE
jgi:hypothetical protein